MLIFMEDSQHFDRLLDEHFAGVSVHKHATVINYSFYFAYDS